MTGLSTPEAADLRQRVAKALGLAGPCSGIDEFAHRTWVIDQMVRALCGCPIVKTPVLCADGSEYELERQDENDEYHAFLSEYEGGGGGHEWEMGTPP